MLTDEEMNNFEKELDAVGDFNMNAVTWLAKKLMADFRIIQQQNKQLMGTIEKCLTGGNSLASLIVAYDLPDDHEKWFYEDASSYFYNRYPLDPDIAYQRYEVWLCWKTLRNARVELESIQGGGKSDN